MKNTPDCYLFNTQCSLPFVVQTKSVSYLNMAAATYNHTNNTWFH